jgi:hypothetical protein
MSKLEKFTKEYSIMGLVGQLKSSQLNRDAEMQRSYVWGNKEQTEFLDSVLQIATTYIPYLIGAESEDEIDIKGKLEKRIQLLDGKQRATTLEKFVNDEIKLGYNIRPVTIEQEDETEKTYIVTGLKWSELPEEVRLLFKAVKIQMIYFKGMTPEERDLQFIKLQGGKKLSNAEINKVRIGHSVREFIYKQLASDLWTKYINISSNREVKFETMQQILMVMFGKWDLSGKSLQAFSEDSEMITDDTDMLKQIEQITEYLNKVVKLIKKHSLPAEFQSLEESEVIEKLEPKQIKKYLKAIDYFKKVNVPIIYTNALKALQNDITVEQYAKFITNFFLDVPARYKRYADSSTADPINVKGRINELDKALVNEFKIIEKVIEQLQNINTDQEATNNIFNIINQNKAS